MHTSYVVVHVGLVLPLEGYTIYFHFAVHPNLFLQK